MVWPHVPERSICKYEKASEAKVWPDVSAKTYHVVEDGDDDYYFIGF
jgi:hypothetical protein